MAVFIASSPNTQKDDLQLIRTILRKPGHWHRQDSRDVHEFARNLMKFQNARHVFCYNTGRAALYSILKAINIKPGDEVIIQAYTCLAVPTGIIWAGARPIFSDIDPGTFNISPPEVKGKIRANTRAVIVQHTFGEPAKINQIREIIDEANAKRQESHKIYLIEDCAHSIGGIHQEHKIGSIGDAAFFSFGQDKAISCTQGGAVSTNDEIIATSLTHHYSSLPNQSKATVFRHLIHPILWNTINRTYYTPPVLSIGKGLILSCRAMGLLRKQVDTDLRILKTPDIRRLSDAQSLLVNNQLAKIDKFISHRRHIASIYNETIPKVLRVSGKEHTFLRFPLQVEDPQRLTSELKRKRVIQGNWYFSPIHPLTCGFESVGYTTGSCPNAESAAQMSINLPTHINVTSEDASRIAAIVSDHLV